MSGKRGAKQSVTADHGYSDPLILQNVPIAISVVRSGSDGDTTDAVTTRSTSEHSREPETSENITEASETSSAPVNSSKNDHTIGSDAAAADTSFVPDSVFTGSADVIGHQEVT